MLPSLDVKRGYAPIENGQLYYEVAGSGRPLVLVHAGVADYRMWDQQFAEFATQYRVVRYDTRGFGKSRTDNTTFSNRQDLRDLLDHLEIEQAAVLGLSRGGQIAIDFTLEAPERVTALIPCAAGLGGFNYQATPEENARFEEMDKLWEARHLEPLIDLEEITWVVGFYRAPEQVDPAVRRRIRTMLTEGYNAHKHEQIEARPLTPPAAGRLAEIRVPTLVLVGDKDTSDTVQVARYLAQHISGAQYAVIPDTAHMINMEKPTEFNRLVLDFLAAL